MVYKQFSPFVAKILSVPKSEQLSESEAGGKL